MVVRFGFRIAASRAEAHLDALGARGRDILADIVWPDRDGAMSTIDQDRQLDRGWTPALPDRRHRALHGPFAVNHVVDQDYRAVFDDEGFGPIDRMQGIVGLVHVESGARRKDFGF